MPVLEIDRPVGEKPVDSDRCVPTPQPPPVGPQLRVPTYRVRRPAERWRPLAGQALLDRLRVTGRPRPTADPELALRLRSLVEGGLPGVGAAGPAALGANGSSRHGDAGSPAPTGPTLPLVVTKDRLTRVLACEAHQMAEEFGTRVPTLALACGALVDVLFRQLVCTGVIADPMADGLAGLSVGDRQAALASWIERLPAADGAQLRAEVERQAEGLSRRWPTLEPGWLPRTQESMRVGLADGAIELSARPDLAIGAPAVDEASVAMVEIKSGGRRAEHRTDLHFYALLEALRSPAPPFVVATYYTRTGELDVEPVTEELLVDAARRTATGTRLLWDLAQGSPARRSPSHLCRTCVARPDCGPGGGTMPGAAQPDRPGAR
jgi:hypothetical protein